MSSAENLEARVVRVAEEALKESQYVAPLDVLVGLRWLHPFRIDEWRQGRLSTLEDEIQVNPSKVSRAMNLFRRWATANGLIPSETAYAARTRDRRQLRFSVGGDPAVEVAYRTHWVSPALSETKRDHLAEQQSRPPDLVVISPLNEDWRCVECSGTGHLLMMEGPGPICMACADMDHLVFLPAGDAALTRRAKAASGLSAVVVRFNRIAKRYQRQGLLVEEAALEQAEGQCLADAEARRRRQERDTVRVTPRTANSSPASPTPSSSSSLVACRSGRRASPRTRLFGAADGSVGAPPVGRLIPRPSPSPSLPPFVTPRRDMTPF